MNQVEAQIAPQLKGQVTERDIIAALGTLELVVSPDAFQQRGGLFFGIKSETYRLEVGISEGGFFIKRCGKEARLQLSNFANKDERKIVLHAIWAPTEIRVHAGTKSRKCVQKMTTAATLPPNALLEWARRKSIAPSISYQTPEDLYETVSSQILSINDKVSTIGMRNPFWDIQYSGSKIISRIPKRETDIQPTINGFLYDQSIAKNLNLVPEVPLAGGRLDFLMNGSIAGGVTKYVCIEVKNAHSDDLEYGLTSQLPTYMSARACDFGVYCILYFRGKYFEEPKGLEINDIGIKLNMVREKAGLLNIRIIVLDLSYKSSPSQK